MNTILVVDDTAAFREPIAACLRARGYTVMEAAHGHDALVLIEKSKPDLILLDIGMPVMDGLAFLERMLADPKHRDLPVIVMTAIAEKDYIFRAAKLGIRDYMLKSQFSLKELLLRVEARLKSNTKPKAEPAARVAATPVATAVKPAAVSRASAPTAAPRPATHIGMPAAGTGAALAKLERMITRQQVEERIRACEQISAWSPTVSNVLGLTNRSSCSIEEVARAIKQDQWLALKVLKMANSVVYARGNAVSSIDLAVSRIGMAQIRQMLMTISIIDKISGGRLAGRLKPMHFWEHSICCGVIAAELTRRVKGDETEIDAAFTMSLLHDTGRMVLAEQFDDLYGRVLDESQRLALPLELVESRMMGVNHAEIMDMLLRQWQFGQHLSRPIASHHLSSARLCDKGLAGGRAAAILALSDRLAHALMVGSSGNDTIYPTHELIAHLGLDPAAVDNIAAAAIDQTSEIKCALLSSANADPWPSWLSEMQKRAHPDIHALSVSAARYGDAFGLALHRLTGYVQDKRPNVAVLHVSQPKDRAAMPGLLRDAEHGAAVEQPLPLLLITPENMPRLDDPAILSRKITYLRTPVCIAQMVDALNELTRGVAAIAA